MAAGAGQSRQETIRFGEFELDLSCQTLLHGGVRAKLQKQPFQVLELLVQRAPEIVSREEIRRHVWGDTVHIDATQSINFCIRQIRLALGDTSAAPRFIETLPRQGYRFIAPLQVIAPLQGGPVNAGMQDQQKRAEESLVRGKPRIARTLMALACAAIAVAPAWFLGKHITFHAAAGKESDMDSIAVLPLTDLARDRGDEIFADGMTEELITELAKLGSFRVISRTSVMRYKRTDRPLTQIGRELNVNAVVEGTVRRLGDRVRITVQLVRTSPERHVWADAYEGNIRDVLSVQRDVARDIGSKVQAKLAGPLARPDTIKRLDPEAYEAYLRGRYFLARRNAESMKKALQYFQQAVQRDPQYAQAYAGLANIYLHLGTYELLPPEESFLKAKEFAGKALLLDNALAEAYVARAGAASFWEFDWAAAERDFERAIALDPNSAFAHHLYGEHFINIGKAERALSELKRARNLDPLSLPINSTLGRMYRDARRYSEAIEQCKKALELDPNFSMGHWCLGQAYVAQREYLAAIPELERANALGTTPLLFSDLGYAYASAGRTAEARAIVNALQQKTQSAYTPPYLIAKIYGALGEKDEAFKWLERAYNERDAHITYLALDPELDTLRSDPRFAILLERLKIPQ
jgi:TolB-like protein/DNA-binding winged helix-turn-helix (wHTH) protein/Tfp pilus assembly protein PilF